jgi:hypothetical protein
MLVLNSTKLLVLCLKKEEHSGTPTGMYKLFLIIATYCNLSRCIPNINDFM